MGDEVTELGYIDMFRDMLDALDAGREPMETFYDGYVVNAVMDAAYASAESGKWEPVRLQCCGRGVERIARRRREHDCETVEPVERLRCEHGVHERVVERDLLRARRAGVYVAAAVSEHAPNPSSGSTATTRANLSTSMRVSLPVPAPSSSTADSGGQVDDAEHLRRPARPPAFVVVAPGVRRSRVDVRQFGGHADNAPATAR